MRRNLEPNSEKICVGCGLVFVPGIRGLSKWLATKFCSRQCHNIWKKGKPRAGCPGAVERFWDNVVKTPGCWIWVGGRSTQGYGVLSVLGKRTLAHRFSYELHGSHSAGPLFVCHSCDNPSCVNPSHLFLGTVGDNARDSILKGRAATGLRAGSAKLKQSDVLLIRSLYVKKKKGDGTVQSLARRFGVSVPTITAVGKYRRYHDVVDGINESTL